MAVKTKERTVIDGIKVYCAYDEIMDIEELKPNPLNPNTHPKQQIKMLAEIIEKTGWRAPITVSTRSGFIVKGHGRLQAAKLAGFTKVPVEMQNFTSEDEEKAALLADNRIAELSEIDNNILSEMFEDFNFEDYGNLTGYSQEDYDALVTAIEEPEQTADEDTVIAPPKVAFTKPGDIWELGRHRLICGDSSKIKTYQKLLGDDKADMVLTDPPYNVDYEGKTKDKLKIQNDKKTDNEFYSFLLSCFTPMVQFLKEGGAFYCWHADSERVNFQTALEAAGVLVKQNIVWVKNTMVMGRQDYQWKHEPCLYGWRAGAAHWFVDDRKQTTVWNCDKPVRNDIHPTMKPVELFLKAIENSTKPGGIVVDGFGGSGTTIISCEKSGRIARVVELDTTFCDSIVKRYLTIYKGATATCIRDGEVINHPLKAEV
ncbi:MAG: site-specific DNA-methyltransferase [Bacteroidales bacterium]|nr:site-specific DNA-methyltransferase [Bacteroidales bacterium]